MDGDDDIVGPVYLSGDEDYSELGLSGVFQKPVDFDALLSLIKSKLA